MNWDEFLQDLLTKQSEQNDGPDHRGETHTLHTLAEGEQNEGKQNNSLNIHPQNEW